MIYADRIRLRAIEREDLPRFVIWLNDPEVRKGLMLYSPLSLVEEEQWFDEMLKRPIDERPFLIEVQQGEVWAPVGNCGFDKINWRCREGIMGIFIGEKQLWDQGLGTLTMNLLLRHGFNTLNLNRIALEVYENNLRAVRAYEKVGFVHEGRRRKAMYSDGKYIDIIQMSILREEWKDI